MGRPAKNAEKKPLTIEEEITEVKKNQNKIIKEINSISGSLAPLKKRIDSFDRQNAEKFMASIEQDVKHLHDRISLLVLKHAVATEAHWFARKFSAEKAAIVAVNAIASMDNPDKWWKARDEWTIAQWVYEFGGIDVPRPDA